MARAEWSLRQAGHLLRRTTFGFTPGQLRQALNDGPEQAIERLLAPGEQQAEFEREMAALTPREPKPQESVQLRLYRMIVNPAVQGLAAPGRRLFVATCNCSADSPFG